MIIYPINDNGTKRVNFKLEVYEDFGNLPISILANGRSSGGRSGLYSLLPAVSGSVR